MTHIQDEGHYQEMMNAQAQAEMEAQAAAAEGEAKSELDALAYEKEYMVRELGVKEPNQSESESQPDWAAMDSLKERELSMGEMLVGIEFNPSGNSEIQRVKELFAEITNTMFSNVENQKITVLHKALIDHALGEILNAQMNVVKVMTFKY